jgi:hypothetical protein
MVWVSGGGLGIETGGLIVGEAFDADLRGRRMP